LDWAASNQHSTQADSINRPSAIRPVGTGGWFRSSLHRQAPSGLSQIPPVGTGGWFRSSLRRQASSGLSQIPPAGTGGWFRSSLHRQPSSGLSQTPAMAHTMPEFLDSMFSCKRHSPSVAFIGTEPYRRELDGLGDRWNTIFEHLSGCATQADSYHRDVRRSWAIGVQNQ
jgi:hypothetical protein